MSAKSLRLIKEKHEEYPFKNSPQSLTLDCEIKRIAAERDESTDKTIKNLADLSNLSERQIYNYRTGKTDIPSGLIPVFCNQFGSNALAMAILKQCCRTAECDDFDIVRLANVSARHTLAAHERFLEAFDDGVIDGFELNELKKQTAAGVANFHRLEQVAEDAYNRRRAA